MNKTPFFAVPSWKAFEVFLLMGMILTAVLVYGGVIANPIAIILTSLGLTIVFMILYWIGFYDEFLGWDSSWRNEVEENQLMVFSSVCSGIPAVLGIAWAVVKEIMDKGRGIKQKDLIQ